jgi:hypothetical protein
VRENRAFSELRAARESARRLPFLPRIYPEVPDKILDGEASFRPGAPAEVVYDEMRKFVLLRKDGKFCGERGPILRSVLHHAGRLRVCCDIVIRCGFVGEDVDTDPLCPTSGRETNETGGVGSRRKSTG